MSASAERPRASVIVTTYNEPALLRRVLLALRRQTARPDEVVVADDGSGPATAAMLAALAPELPFPLVHVRQPDEGFRAARSRNNGIYHARGPAIAFLDQDTLPHHGWLAAHLARLAPGTVCIGNALECPELAADRITDACVEDGGFESMYSRAARRRLLRQHRSYCFYAWMRRLGLPQKAKPTPRSSNIAIRRDDLVRINGFDETYVGWGQEDDDLGRRLYLAGVRPRIVVRHALASHCSHERRGPDRWEEGANVARYLRPLHGPRCEQGLDRHPHPDVSVTRLA